MAGLKNDILFGGLTRPPMIFGVTYMYFVFNLLISLLYFIVSSDFKVVIVGGGVHAISYLICQKEPLLIDMFIMRQSKCNKCKNLSYHKYKQSFEPF